MKPIIEIKNLAAGYDGRTVLHDINLNIYERDFLGIIGPNGGGKTTLIKCILGLLKPTAGEIIFHAPTEASSHSQLSTSNPPLSLGYLPQYNTIDRKFPISVEEVILSGLSIQKSLTSRFTPEQREKGKHIITSKIEHHAILHTCDYLASRGYEITYIDVDENGVIKLDQLKAAIRPDTILISVMFANNEIGTIQPIEEIGAIAKEHGILFHTDAVQAYCQVPIDVDKMHIDMLSISGHKINGPKGIGFLYIRKGVKIRSFIHGGAQERKRRAGTENVPSIVGLGKAVEVAVADMEERTSKEIELRDRMIDAIYKRIPYARLNGDRTRRLPNNVNFSFQFVEGESMLIMLDMAHICASSGSACTSGSLDPSHVLLAIGLPH